ncbi:MAG: sigma-54-dependent Fis family transcriptional regulator [Bacteroidia bacterium]|nr:sigma-54-dependent Fis family transcriptional regulator [Bacteroidia bacterium]
MSSLQDVKNRFEIIGQSSLLNIALETATKVAPTDISVLITGESGVGKEAFSKIIHALSKRKHGPFIAVNCGAIPGGTIDSELFGHEKGSFTGAGDMRKGYFETVSGGTIFLDEVGELPLETQSRLLRVLESGEFIKVGSSKVQKTDVRIIAATNRDLLEFAHKGRFREDLYYRLCTVPIKVPPLRERKEDIYTIFRKFALDFADAYHMQPITLNQQAQHLLVNYRWPGNIRQLKNITEQLSVLEENRNITGETMLRYLPEERTTLPTLSTASSSENGFSERDIFYKVLYDMRKDVSDLKKLVVGLIQHTANRDEFIAHNQDLIGTLFNNQEVATPLTAPIQMAESPVSTPTTPFIVTYPKEHMIEASEALSDTVTESLSLEHKEIEMIRKALDKHKGRRKRAADELGISERTLYRKIKQYNIEG